MLQWGHSFSAVEIEGSTEFANAMLSRFNGATAFQPWRSAASSPSASSCFCASMGPQLFSRGDCGDESCEEEQDEASMGPQLFSRGDAIVTLG